MHVLRRIHSRLKRMEGGGRGVEGSEGGMGGYDDDDDVVVDSVLAVV